jgi:hypothetical protein
LRIPLPESDFFSDANSTAEPESEAEMPDLDYKNDIDSHHAELHPSMNTLTVKELPTKDGIQGGLITNILFDTFFLSHVLGGLLHFILPRTLFLSRYLEPLDPHRLYGIVCMTLGVISFSLIVRRAGSINVKLLVSASLTCYILLTLNSIIFNVVHLKSGAQTAGCVLVLLHGLWLSGLVVYQKDYLLTNLYPETGVAEVEY